MEKEESKSYRCCPYMQQFVGYTTGIDNECSDIQYPVDPGCGCQGFYGYGWGHHGWSHHGSHRDGESLGYPTEIDDGDFRPFVPNYGYPCYGYPNYGYGWGHHGWSHHHGSHHGSHRDGESQV